MFRFTIRDLLWLMVVVALILLSWRDRVLLNAERARLREEQKLLLTKQRQADTSKSAFEAQFLRIVDATDQLNNQLMEMQKTK